MWKPDWRIFLARILETVMKQLCITCLPQVLFACEQVGRPKSESLGVWRVSYEFVKTWRDIGTQKYGSASEYLSAPFVAMFPKAQLCSVLEKRQMAAHCEWGAKKRVRRRWYFALKQREGRVTSPFRIRLLPASKEIFAVRPATRAVACTSTGGPLFVARVQPPPALNWLASGDEL